MVPHDEVVFWPVAGEPGFRGVWRQCSSELRTVNGKSQRGKNRGDAALVDVGVILLHSHSIDDRVDVADIADFAPAALGTGSGDAGNGGAFRVGAGLDKFMGKNAGEGIKVTAVCNPAEVDVVAVGISVVGVFADKARVLVADALGHDDKVEILIGEDVTGQNAVVDLGSEKIGDVAISEIVGRIGAVDDVLSGEVGPADLAVLCQSGHIGAGKNGLDGGVDLARSGRRGRIGRPSAAPKNELELGDFNHDSAIILEFGRTARARGNSCGASRFGKHLSRDTGGFNGWGAGRECWSCTGSGSGIHNGYLLGETNPIPRETAAGRKMGYGTERNYGRGRAASRSGLRTRHRSSRGSRPRLPTAAWSVGIVTEDRKTFQETLGAERAGLVFFEGSAVSGQGRARGWPSIEIGNAFAHGGFMTTIDPESERQRSEKLYGAMPQAFVRNRSFELKKANPRLLVGFKAK